MPSSFSSFLFTGQSKNMQKLNRIRAQVFVRKKNTIFSVVGTVVLRSSIPIFMIGEPHLPVFQNGVRPGVSFILIESATKPKYQTKLHFLKRHEIY